MANECDECSNLIDRIAELEQRLEHDYTERDSLRARVVELEKERDEAISANLREVVAELQKTKTDRDDADDSAWRRLIEIDRLITGRDTLQSQLAEMRADVERMQPVFDAAVLFVTDAGSIGAIIDAVTEIDYPKHTALEAGKVGDGG